MAIGISGCELVKCAFWVNDECAHTGNGCFHWGDNGDNADFHDLKLLNELREIAKRKGELWEVDSVGFGLTWRKDALALEYQKFEDRVWEIKRELFGDYAIEV